MAYMSSQVTIIYIAIFTMQCIHFSVEMAFKYILVYYKCWSLHLTKHFKQQKTIEVIMNLHMKSYFTGSNKPSKFQLNALKQM